MFDRFTGRSTVPSIDLVTVRETLVYMRDDMHRHARLDKAADALNTAIREIDKSIALSSYKPIDSESHNVLKASFLPSWRPSRDS